MRLYTNIYFRNRRKPVSGCKCKISYSLDAYSVFVLEVNKTYGSEIMLNTFWIAFSTQDH